MKHPKEGTLYKTLVLFGKTFELRYGYYDDRERESAFGEPLPIYPDFGQTPVYTDEGYPFVTKMQALCEHGESRFADGYCADCPHFLQGEEMLGICRCERNRRAADA